MSYSHTDEHFSNIETASPESLKKQAHDTASMYLKKAITNIDKAFGKGYAKGHPELVGRFMSTCAADFHTAFQAKLTLENNKWVASALFDIAKSLRLLGNGNIDRGDLAPGAIEGLAMIYRDKAEKIAEAIGWVSSSLDKVAEANEKKANQEEEQ